MIVTGQAHKDTMFIQFLDNLYKAALNPKDDPVALMKVQGMAATAK